MPGLILGFIAGGSSLLTTVATVRGGTAGFRLSLVAGIIMMGWIVGEVAILYGVGFTVLWPFSFAVGLVMVLLGLWLSRQA